MFPNSRTYIKMKNTGHTLFLTAPVSKIHNVVVGSMWIEHYGDMTIRNLTTGDYAIVEFSKSGVFKIGAEYKLAGCVFDKSGKKMYVFTPFIFTFFPFFRVFFRFLFCVLYSFLLFFFLFLSGFFCRSSSFSSFFLLVFFFIFLYSIFLKYSTQRRMELRSSI